MGNIYIVPEREELEESIRLAKEYNLGWEFDDYFEPGIFTAAEKAADLTNKYKTHFMPPNKTLHGAFLDITVFSSDPEISRVSDMRVRQSLQFAGELGAKSVIFHTNFLPTFDLKAYKDAWVLNNASYWRNLCSQYRDKCILIENMFDLTPELIVRLAEALTDVPNFGICFDYAHATISGLDIEEWAKAVAPFVKHIHINDNDLKSDMHQALGQGLINWQQFAGLYKKYFPEASILLEMRGIDKQEKSIKFIRELL